MCGLRKSDEPAGWKLCKAGCNFDCRCFWWLMSASGGACLAFAEHTDTSAVATSSEIISIVLYKITLNANMIDGRGARLIRDLSFIWKKEQLAKKLYRC